MMTTYKINQLLGEAWQTAIDEVAKVINDNFNLNLFRFRDYATIENMAESLGIRFNAFGEIIK